MSHILVLTCLCFAFAAPPAWGQVSALTPLVDALADNGRSESPSHSADPVAARQTEIAQHRGRYNNPQLDHDERAAALARAIDMTRDLIRTFPDHAQQPIWQTDLAEMLCIDRLQVVHHNAAEFYVFGVPTAEQRHAYAHAVVESYRAASDADRQLSQLQTQLPREQDRIARQIDAKLWSRLMDEYRRKRTPYYLAYAALHTALLPDTHAYYQAHGDAGAAVEQARLLEETITRLAPFVADTSDRAGVRTPAVILTAQAQLAQGDPAAAIALLTPILHPPRNDLFSLTAHLAQAAALHAQHRYDDALNLLASLNHHPLVRQNVLYRLLVTDAVHRVRLAQAEPAPPARRAQALAAACEPYLTLLADPAVSAHAAALRQHIFSRWADDIELETDLAALPPVVRAGVAEVARQRGQNLAHQAERARDAARRAQAEEQLALAVRLGESVTRADAPPPVFVRAAYNAAAARYLLDPNDTANLLAVARQMTDLAEALPAEPLAEDAITLAVNLLRSLHRLTPRSPGVEAAYRRAADVLFHVFPTTAAADSERLYFGYHVLEAAGEYTAAAQMYAQVPFVHRDYFEAQRHRLIALQQALTQPDERDAVAQEARRVRAEAEAALAADSIPERETAARRALAGAGLTLARLALDAREPGAAIEALASFDDHFADQPALLRDAMELRILAFVAADQLDDACAQAARMMHAYPDHAATVIDRVLTGIDARIETRRAEAAAARTADQRQSLEADARQLAHAAIGFAALLLDWAHTQPFDAQRLLPFQLIHAKALRLADQPAAAAAELEPLIAQFPAEATVIHEYAEALFAQGSDADLIRAARHYDQLIAGLRPPYPDTWWNAWMRRLQINDRLDQATADIPLRVGQLKLTDPALGGPPYQAALESLAAKHQR